jgi:hypothetical protein
MRLSAPSFLNHRTVLTGLTALACAACAVPAATPTPDMGYRLVVENGTSSVSGKLSAPKAFFAASVSLFERGAEGGLALSEAPVEGASVQVLDGSGKVNARVLPVKTDALGRFTLRGLRLGEPAFVQAQFKGADASERTLLAYVRPERDQVCLDVSLASTLVVHKIIRTGQSPGMFASDKVAELVAKATIKLPDLLTDALDGTATDLNQAVTDLLTSATSGGGGGIGALPGSSGSIIDKVFDDADLKDGLNQAVETFLDVTFTILGFGANDAAVLRPDRIRQLLIGRVELVCQPGQEPYQHVAFWLNNQSVAEAQFDGQSYVGALDTQALADGPYVLSAVVKRRSGAEPTIIRSFVYVRNTAPAREAPCEAWGRDGEGGTP